MEKNIPNIPIKPIEILFETIQLYFVNFVENKNP